jgi:hypothetical protein
VNCRQSILLSSNPPPVVQRIAQHADLDVTLGVYAHIDLDAMRQALDSIEWNNLGGAVVAGGRSRFRTCDLSLVSSA